MVDIEKRKQALELLREYRCGEITNMQFSDKFLSLASSPDPALKAINQLLWFTYDDVREYRLTGERIPSSEINELFDRCELFLESGLEYRGSKRFISINPFVWIINGVLSLARLAHIVPDTRAADSYLPFQNIEELARYRGERS
jgi:hypothetical protein